MRRFEHEELTYFENVNLEKYTTIKLGNIGSLVEVKSEDALNFLIPKLLEEKIEFRLVGWGANQVLHKTDCLYIKLDLPMDKNILSDFREEYELPASIGLNKLTAAAIKHGLSGWEVFTGVPASLGGAICMNAGTSLGEIGELVKRIRIFNPEKGFFNFIPQSGSFSYRRNNFLEANDIIVGATLSHRGKDSTIGTKIKEYLQYRKETQPVGTKNCGSVFKNRADLRAGATIDQLGLKGYGFSELSVSMKHGNFIENSDSAKSDQFIELVESLQYQLEMCSGRKFELEVKIY